MMSYRDINKNTVYDVKRKLDWIIPSGVFSATFINCKKNKLQGDCPGHQPGGAHQQRPQQVHEVPGAGDEQFRTTMIKMVSGMSLIAGNYHYIPAGLRPCPQQ
jgi:hypothetical protein